MIYKVTIVDAAYDENHWDGYEGSIPGDQTGEEVRNKLYSEMLDLWYKSRKTHVYRPKREDVAWATAIRMQQCKDNPHCGYSQPNRKGIYEELKNDPDPSHITRDIEGDCSAYVNSVVWATLKSIKSKYAGKINPLARTADMPAMYSNCPEYIEVTEGVNLTTGKGFKQGDILVVPGQHTGMVWDVQEYEEPEIPAKFYVKTKTEVNLRTGPGTKYATCNVQLAPDYVIRHHLRKGEKVKVIEEKDGWLRLEMKGVIYTWYPWCTGKKQYIEYL